MPDDMVEAVARAIWEQQCQHWGRYRDQVPDLCAWEELTQSKQREVLREARAAIAAMQPHIAAAEARGRLAERAAIVKWMRGLGFAHESQNRAVGQMANAIERGDHTEE